MPLKFLPHDTNEIFIGDNAIIIDEDKLIEWVARTLIAKHNHIFNIISSENDEVIISKKSVIQSIINKILHAQNHYHRDGLLFQHISWISYVLKRHEKDIFSIPQCRTSDKGQDLIVIHLDDNENVLNVSICEDKATEHVRNTIRNKIYPEFKDYELGNRDSELESAVLAMLAREFNPDKANKIIEKVFWENIKQYKINITVTNENPLNIFKDYDECIPGNIEKRTGNTTQIDDLRNWFNQFASKIEIFLNSLMVK